MVQGLVSKQHRVFNKNGAGSQDERSEQVDVDVVPCAAEFPATKSIKYKKDNNGTGFDISQLAATRPGNFLFYALFSRIQC